jgi:hypothetical protein
VANQDLIEFCAKAMFLVDMPGRNPDDLNIFGAAKGEPGWSIYINKVRAVLEALREPNEAMIEAAISRPVNEAANDYRSVWQAMLDAALRTNPHE